MCSKCVLCFVEFEVLDDVHRAFGNTHRFPDGETVGAQNEGRLL